MIINWDFVKEQTLWSYEDLIKNSIRPSAMNLCGSTITIPWMK